MGQSQTKVETVRNWDIGKNPNILTRINHPTINTAIYERDIRTLRNEINHLLQQFTPAYKHDTNANWYKIK